MKLQDNLLPDIWFGEVGERGVNWREVADEFDPDDEETEETPADVIDLLGFDPKELGEVEEKQVGILAVLKGGPGSGNFGHSGRPGEVGGSGEGVGGEKVEGAPEPTNLRSTHHDWNELKTRSEINQTLKKDYKIKRVVEVGTSNPAKGEFGRKVGFALDNICSRHPGLQELLLKHKAISEIRLDGASTKIEGTERANGLYTPPSGYGGGAKIQVLVGGQFSDWWFGPIAPRGSWHPVEDNRAADTLTHELGHHVHMTCLNTRQREKWSDTVEKAATMDRSSIAPMHWMSGNGEVEWLKQNISTYAGSSAKEFTTKLGTMSLSRDKMYSEGFAEAFCKFVSPYYRGDLPKPIHDFMTKIVTPKQKKGKEYVTRAEVP